MTGSRPDDPGDEPDPIPVDDYERLAAALAKWCDGEFERRTVDGVERAVCATGRAQFAVTADGRVDAGMPLHAFDAPAESLAFEADAVRVLTGDGEYVFRRP